MVQVYTLAMFSDLFAFNRIWNFLSLLVYVFFYIAQNEYISGVGGV